MTGKTSFAVVVIAAIAAASPAWADGPCQLTKVTGLDIGIDAAGNAYVPIVIAGHKLNLLVDTGGIYSMLTERTAKSLALRQKHMARSRIRMYGGAVIDRYVTANDITLGQLTTAHWKFPVMPDSLPAEIAGTLSSDIMRNYDVDFDFAASKLNLFSRDHCPGHVVYWTRAEVAQIPVGIDMGGHLKAPVELDGQELEATIDTGSSRSIMSLETAERKFSFEDGDSRLKSIAQRGGAYTYPFKTLSLKGVVVTNPDVVLVPDRESHLGAKGPRLILGMDILRQLHMYIAYKERKLYVTAASADRNTVPADAQKWNELTSIPVSLRCAEPAVEGQFTPEGPPGFVTAKVTFAINSDPVSGAVHVTPGSDGVCTVRAKRGAVIASSTFALDPGVSGVDSSGDLLKHVGIKEAVTGGDSQPDAKAYVFTVKAMDGAQGKLVLDFPVRYR